MSDQSFEDIDNEIYGDGPTATGEEPVAPAEATPAVEETPPEPETEPVVEAEAAPKAEPTASPDGAMPYGAYSAEKTKRKEYQEKAEAAEAKAAQLEARLATLEKLNTPKPEQKPAPDPLDDPKAFGSHVEKQISTQVSPIIDRLNRSDAYLEFDKATVDGALTAVKAHLSANPAQAARFTNSANPYVEAVKWHKEQSTLQTVGGDLDAFLEAKRAEWIAQNQPATEQPANPGTPQQAATPAPVIPPNLAGRTSAAPGNTAEPSYEDIDAELWGNR